VDVERYCRGLNDWPRSWRVSQKDLLPGEKLVSCFRPFLQYLVACADLSPKTIQKHQRLQQVVLLISRRLLRRAYSYREGRTWVMARPSKRLPRP
jgi:hypothetical protein